MTLGVCSTPATHAHVSAGTREYVEVEIMWYPIQEGKGEKKRGGAGIEGSIITNYVTIDIFISM